MEDKDRRLENTINQVIFAHKSALWWQQQMSKGLQELHELDKEDPYKVSEKRPSVESKVEYLIAKGEWEDRNLDKVMSTVESFEESDKRQIVSEIHRRVTAKESQDDSLD